MISINTNTASLMARSYGQQANKNMLEPLKRLSSGLRINAAADDAAGLSVSSKLLRSIKSYSMGIRNSVDMINLLQTAESSLSKITDIQLRGRELAVQAANGVYTDEERDKMEQEIRAIVGELDRVAENTKYNDVALLDGTFSGSTVQTGKGTGDHVNLDIDEIGSCTIGRFWESDTYDNGDFSEDKEPLALGDDSYAIPGWIIHNKRVELGEDGSTGPSTIGGWATPEDPTPRPYDNTIDYVMVEKAGSQSTTDNALSYGATYNNVSGSAPGGGGATAQFTVTIGNMTDVSITSGASTSNPNMMGVSDVPSPGVSGSAPAAGGVAATFDVEISRMRVSSNITNNASLTAGNYTATGSHPRGGTAATFTITVAANGDIDVEVATTGDSYQTGDTITIDGGDIGGTSGVDDLTLSFLPSTISVELATAGSGYKVGEVITIDGALIGGTSGVDDVVVAGTSASMTILATSGSGYSMGEAVTLSGADMAAGASNVNTTVVGTPPGNDDSVPPSGTGTLANPSETGFEIESGAMKLNTGSLTSRYGWDIVHGPYIISDDAKQINAGEKVIFDWKAEGTNDAFDVFAYLLNEDTGETQIMLDQTQPSAGATPWVTQETTVTADGNYRFVFVNGTYDATGGRLLGAAMYIDNIRIERNRLPPEEQHTVCKVNLMTIGEAQNAISVFDLALSQLASVRSKLGAQINRLNNSIQVASSISMNSRMARSRILDAEYTIETSKLAKYQILSQASLAMLAQANKQNHLIVELLNY